MVRSDFCNLHGMSRAALIALHEDPNDAGGYFIIRGGEHSIDAIENVSLNDMRITTEMHGREAARVQILSKFGDGFENSYQLIITRMSNGAIMFIPQIATVNDAQIPFAVFFRLIADCTDEDIARYIIGDINATDALSTALITMLEIAFANQHTGGKFDKLIDMRDHATIAMDIGNEIFKPDAVRQTATRDESVQRAVYAQIMSEIDKKILPHLGMTREDRPKKLRYMGYAINKMFLTILGILDPLDRDSLATKRIHPAGIAVSKAFKTMFAHAVTTPIKNAITAAFGTMPFASVDLGATVSAIVSKNERELNSAMANALTVGNTEVRIGQQRRKNRVSSQPLYRKNDMNTRGTGNNIAVANTSANKQNTRADLMRRVHPTMLGYIDGVQSVDTGEKVGMNKQMAVTAIISRATSGDNLKEAIIKHEGASLINIADDPSHHLSIVLVNGVIIGCVDRDWEFVSRWRMYRRRAAHDDPIIHRMTSIIWDHKCREVRFWTDQGRMLRPLIIVYNNLAEYNARSLAAFASTAKHHAAPDREDFAQWTRVTREIIGKFMRGHVSDDTGSTAVEGEPVADMEWLQNEGIIEYIAADECDNTLIAPSLSDLRERRHDLCMRYTHCDIEQAIFGIVTLASPLTNHAYGMRTTYYCNQRKQSCSWYSCAFPYRSDKKTMFQYYCDRSLVSCMADRFANPNGHSCIVMINQDGYNQEDSIIVNRSSVDRGMFNGAFFDYEIATCDRGETFAIPAGREVIDRQVSANAEFLENGVARVGTVVSRNSVLISKVASVVSGDSRNGGELRHIDRSIIYMNRTPAHVVRVIRGENERGSPFIYVGYRQNKCVIDGDKLSSLTGNKGIVALLADASNMPFAEDGTIPDIIINPYSIPTRRALNQQIETVLGEYAIRTGCYVDATSSIPIDLDAVLEQLKARGFTHVGYKRMYNGHTGDWIDAPICIGPTQYQRLEKFVDNECRAVRHGPVDAITRQPLRVGPDHGALRIGEMEAWVMVGHGAMRTFAEKFVTDADGTTTHICRRCGHVAVCNPDVGVYKCAFCREFAQISEVPSTWIANVVREEVRSLGVQMQFEVEPRQFFVRGSGADVCSSRAPCADQGAPSPSS
jgi:DNA-directed RNA polymerase II subunit RPB2